MQADLRTMQAFQIRRKVTAASGFAELGLYQGSMGIYVFNRENLLHALDNDMDDFGKHILPEALQKRKVMAPDAADWYIALAFAIRRAQSLAAAEVILCAAVQKFPANATIHFNLACYYAQLGDLDKARLYLQRAIAIDENFKAMALNDPDLRPLRE